MQRVQAYFPAVAGTPAAVVRAAIDPLVAALWYVALALVFHDAGRDGFVIVTLTCLLMYPGRVPFGRFDRQAALRIASHWGLVLVLLYALRQSERSVPVPGADGLEVRLILLWALTAPGVLILMHLVSPRVAPYVRSVYTTRKAVIVGVTELALRLAAMIDAGEADGQRVIGYFDDRSVCRVGNRRAPEVVGTLAQVADHVKRHGVEIIYICLPMTTQPRILQLLEELRDTTASIYFVPDIFVADLIQARVDLIGGVPVVSICESPLYGSAAVLKRILDLTVTLVALPLAVPLMLAIGIVIRATSAGPALFRQRRYGLDGREIDVWKFRTMKTLEDGDKVYRQVSRDDERVTRVGRFLRRTSLDELPQLINVLAGSMSLVGPRPHALAVNEQCRRMIPGYMVRHKVRPGITGWAQVNGHRGGDGYEAMRARTEFDLEYLRSWSLALDLQIIWKTGIMLMRGDPKAY